MILSVPLNAQPIEYSSHYFSTERITVLDADYEESGYLENPAMAVHPDGSVRVFTHIDSKDNSIHYWELTKHRDEWARKKISVQLPSIVRLDPREYVSAMTFSGNTLYCLLANLVIVIRNNQFIRSFYLHNGFEKIESISENRLLLSFYFYNRKPHLQLATIDTVGNEIRTISPHQNNAILTGYWPRVPIDVHDSLIAVATVNPPVLRLYDHDLMLLDSVNLEIPYWITPEKNATGDDDITFENLPKLLDTGLSKIQDLQFIDSTHILITSLLGSTCACETLVECKAGQLHQGASTLDDYFMYWWAPQSEFDKIITKKDYSCFAQNAHGIIHQNHLYYLIAGYFKSIEGLSIFDAQHLSEIPALNSKLYYYFVESVHE
jgi:hypothetical protein